MARYGWWFRFRAAVCGHAEDRLARIERPEHVVSTIVDDEHRMVAGMREVYVEAQAYLARLEHQHQHAQHEHDVCTRAARADAARGEDTSARVLLERAETARNLAEHTRTLIDQQHELVARLERDITRATAAAQLRAAHAQQITTTAHQARLAERHTRLLYGDHQRRPAEQIFTTAQYDAAALAARAQARHLQCCLVALTSACTLTTAPQRCPAPCAGVGHQRADCCSAPGTTRKTR